MQTIILIAILASAAAAPAYLLAETPVYRTSPLTSKSTYTQSSQVIDHGSTFIHTPVVHSSVLSVAHSPLTLTKTTITKSNNVVNHGGSTILHPVHTYEPLHDVYHVPKTTVTKSNQIVNHGSTSVVHAPIVHAPFVHTSVVHAPVLHTPVVHAHVVHTPVVYHSSPVVTYKSGDSAISHQSSTVHETVPVLKSSPAFVALHH